MVDDLMCVVMGWVWVFCVHFHGVWHWNGCGKEKFSIAWHEVGRVRLGSR